MPGSAAHAGVGALVESEVRPCAAPDCATGPYGTRGSFKVPKHVLFLTAEELPTTPTGKVRKFELAHQAAELLKT